MTHEQLITEIRAKAVEERTPAEIALLEMTETPPTEGEIDWEKAFKHPRFKQLVDDRRSAQEALKALQDARLKEANDFKSLYETAKSDLESEKTRSVRAEQLQEVLQHALDAELGTLTPAAKKLVPAKLSVEDQLEWITSNRALLEKPAAQNVGAGGRLSMLNGKPAKAPELSPSEKQVARAFGYTEEEYLKFKDMPAQAPFAALTSQPGEDESSA